MIPAPAPEHLAWPRRPARDCPPQAWGVDDIDPSLWSDECPDRPNGLPRPGFHQACSSVLLDSALQFILDDVDFDEPPLGVRNARHANPRAARLSTALLRVPPHCLLPLCPACLLACVQASASPQLSWVSVPSDLPSLDIGAEPSKLAVGYTWHLHIGVTSSCWSLAVALCPSAVISRAPVRASMLQVCLPTDCSNFRNASRSLKLRPCCRARCARAAAASGPTRRPPPARQWRRTRSPCCRWHRAPAYCPASGPCRRLWCVSVLIERLA